MYLCSHPLSSSILPITKQKALILILKLIPIPTPTLALLLSSVRQCGVHDSDILGNSRPFIRLVNLPLLLVPGPSMAGILVAELVDSQQSRPDGTLDG